MSADAGVGEVPEPRRAGLRQIGERLLAARRLVLTTHLNADGDGVGSQCAVARWLESGGAQVNIVNPTPFPPNLSFLPHREGLVVELGFGGEERVRDAELVLVLDTSEPKRLGDVARLMEPGRTVVIDHHPAGPEVAGTLAVQDPTACAAGELVYDLIRIFDRQIPAEVALPIYVALVSDTGSFRYANTTPRTHQIAADLLALGVDPEAVFQRLYATVPLRRLELLRAALGSVRTDDRAPITYMLVTEEDARRVSATTEDFEGLVDHARAVEGTEVAILFREAATGTKLSLRSNGAADVNRIARDFSGGGHTKAAGGFVDQPPAIAIPRVLERTRRAIAEG